MSASADLSATVFRLKPEATCGFRLQAEVANSSRRVERQDLAAGRAFPLYMETFQEGDSGEQLPDSSGSVCDPQHAVGGDGHVVRLHQFAEAGRVDIGHSRQVQNDLSRASAEERSDLRPQSGADRRTQRTLEVKHRRFIMRLAHNEH
jgi:hypothetical protein